MVIDSRGAVWAPGVVVTAPGFDLDHGFRQRLEAPLPEQLVTGVILNTWGSSTLRYGTGVFCGVGYPGGTVCHSIPPRPIVRP